MKFWKCIFEAQKGNPGRKDSDFEPIKTVYVQSKFKSGARPIAEEELQVWDRVYPTKYKAPVIDKATELEFTEYEKRKLALTDSVDNGKPEYIEGAEEDALQIQVLELPIDQPWKLAIGLVDVDGEFQSSMALLNRQSGATAFGNIESIQVQRYQTADMAINAAIEKAMAMIVDLMADQLGKSLESSVRILKGYRSLKENEKLNRIKETILVNVNGDNLEQQSIDTGTDEQDVDAMLMAAITDCIANYSGDFSPEPEECIESLMHQITEETDIEAMCVAIRALKNPFVMTHSSTVVNFVAGFKVEPAEEANEEKSREVPISKEGQAMLDRTAESSRKAADKDWPIDEEASALYATAATSVKERASDYVYDTADLWQSLAYKILTGSKEQNEPTADQYFEIGKKLEGVFTERNIELMNGEFFSEIASEMIRHASGAESILPTMLNLREVRKFTDEVISHVNNASKSSAQITKNANYTAAMLESFERQKRLMSEEVFWANREVKHDGKPNEYENELRRRSAEEIEAGKELYVDGFRIIESSISKTDLGAESQEEAKDILCSGVLTLANQSVAWQLIHGLMTGSIGKGNTMTEEVIAAIFTAGCVELYRNNEKPEFDPFNVEKSALKFYKPLLRRYCSGDLDPESIILEYVNENQEANQQNLEDESDISSPIAEPDSGDDGDVIDGEVLNETVDASNHSGSNERSDGDNPGYSLDDAVKDLSEPLEQDNQPTDDSDGYSLDDAIKDLNETLDALAVGELLILDDLPNDVYHGAKGISSSNIKEEMVSSMYRHNRETGEIERTQRKCFDFGNYIHTLLLQPHLANVEYAYEKELPEGGFDSTESLVKAIDKENESRTPLATNDDLKALIEAHNASVPEKLSTNGNKEEIAELFNSLPEEFKLLEPEEKENATTYKKYIMAYNATLPSKLKLNGNRDALLAEVAKFNPDFIKAEKAKKPTLPTTGTKKELADRIRSFMPNAVFKHELDELWKEEQERGLIPVSIEDIEKGKRIVNSAMSNPAIKNWYAISNDTTACERSYFVKREYQVNVNGEYKTVALILKARLDKEIGSYIVDTKTIELRLDVKEKDAEKAINSEIEKRGYHISAAHYLDVTNKGKFFWIFHNKLKGYEWEFIMEISPEHLELGQYEIADTIMSIAHSEATGIYKAPITQPIADNGQPLPLQSQVSSYANSRLEMFRKMNGEEI